MAEGAPAGSVKTVFDIEEPRERAEPMQLDGRIESSLRDVSSSLPSVIPSPLSVALSRTIESDIIPRLLMAHRRERTSSAELQDPGVDDSEVAALVALATHDSLSRARNFVDAMRARGVSPETVVAEVLPAAARYVGWLWETDACTFVDVTFALSRLQQLLHHYAPSMGLDAAAPGNGRRVLLSVMPGEQHTFGISVVEEMLRRAAWDVVPLAPKARGELLRGVSDEWFDIVGLSVAGDGPLDAMPSLIGAIRDASLNRSVRIVAGGAAVLRSPEFALSAGADAVVTDPRSGMQQMEAMVRAVQQPC